MSVDQADYLVGSKNNNSIFKGDMVLCLLTVIAVIVIERYVNRSDTKAVEQKGGRLGSDEMDYDDGEPDGKKKKKGSFFSQDALLERTSTARSMTVNVKTMKTADLDVQDGAAQDFLKSMYGADESGGSQFDDTRTKITTNQKTKYIMHWILLISAHIFVFWFIPITGNRKLYGKSTCTDAEEKSYGCKNFHKNVCLQIFYLILCVYFMLSALQIRYGFPIMKKPSSVLQFHDDILALVGAQIFSALPFIVEIRCLLDFTFSKTALDIFQFWQLWQYHFEMYCAKNGNVSYTTKVLGSPTPLLDKCIFGVAISVVILFLLVGPLVFFSDIGGFVAPNAVQSADIRIALVINKTLTQADLKEFGFTSFDNNLNQTDYQIDGATTDLLQELEGSTELAASKTEQARHRLHTEIPYYVYENKNPFLRLYGQHYYEHSKFDRWTETRFFAAD
jgi:hypothetical protein